MVLVDVPATAVAGQVLTLAVRAFGPNAIRAVDIQFLRAVTSDERYEFVPARTDTVRIPLSVLMPLVPADSTLEVRVVARDTLGRSSAAVPRTVRIVPPAPGLPP